MVSYLDKDYKRIKDIYDKFCNHELNIENLKNNLLNILVYEDDKKLMGFLEFSNFYERSEINYIYVIEEKRNLGIASELMSFYLKECEKNNIESVTLEVKSNNYSAIHLYKKFGFIKVADRKNYYEDCDGFLMYKEV